MILNRDLLQDCQAQLWDVLSAYLLLLDIGLQALAYGVLQLLGVLGCSLGPVLGQALVDVVPVAPALELNVEAWLYYYTDTGIYGE